MYVAQNGRKAHASDFMVKWPGAGGQGERCTEGNVVSLGEACHAAILAAHKLRANTWTIVLVRAVERLRLDYPL
jgi:hypothetical protein